MSGYQLILKIRNIEEECNQLGLMLCHSKYGGRSEDVVAVKPKNADSFPSFSDDYELFVGSIENLESWIKGFKFARNYDRILFGNKHDSVRNRKEQDVRNRRLLTTLKNSDKVK